MNTVGKAGQLGGSIRCVVSVSMLRFPRVEGYRVELPEERLSADFNDDSVLVLSPDIVGPSITRNSGIIGKGVDMSLTHLGDIRHSSLVFLITQRLLYTKWRDPGEEPKLHLFGQLKRITKQWLDAHHQAVARHLSRVQRRHLSRAAHVSGTGRHGLQPHHRSHHPAVSRRASHQGAARSLQSHRLHQPRQVQHVAHGPLGYERSAAEEPNQLGRARQRLGSRILPCR